MPPVTPDQILQEIADLKSHMQDQTKTLGEKLAETEEAGKKALEGLAELRKQNLSAGTPLPFDIGAAATQRGGMFDGRMRVPYSRMIETPLHDPAILSSDRERLSIMHNAHMAMLFRYHYLKKKAPDFATADWMQDAIRKSPEWPAFVDAMVSSGYVRAANDIINPVSDTNDGAKWDFTILTGTLIELVRLATNVAPQFRQVTLPRAKTDFPAIRADVKALLGPISGTDQMPAADGDNVGAVPRAVYRLKPDLDQVGFDCRHLFGSALYTDDMAQDSIVPIVPILTEQMILGLARAQDDATINGDTQATHIDTDVTALTDCRKAWNGLRRLGMNNEATITAPIASSQVNTLRLKMGKYGGDPSTLVFITAMTEYLKLMADANLLTVDKIGIDRATLRTGVIDRIFGIDYVVSEFVRRDLAADGEFDGVTTDNTVILLCNRTRFWYGSVGEVRTESQRAMQALANWVQADWRVDFKALDLNKGTAIFPTGDAPVAVGIDVTN